MHMADALLSPQVGGGLWAATALTTVYCSRKLSGNPDERKIPLMGVLGAFVFTAQMINFAIPGTGSSGHLGGGLLLAVLLGPYASFLVMASVLTVQALFFADGGLLALGCNIFNLGFFPCLIAYPLIYKPVAGRLRTRTALLYGSIFAAVLGLQMGSLAVVTQTWLSGVIDLSFSSFILLMQPIHLVIGIVEGVITAGVISFVSKARPEILAVSAADKPIGDLPIRNVLITLLVATAIIGGGVTLLISQDPDGLEWSLEHSQTTMHSEKPASTLHDKLAGIQEQTALMPDYQTGNGGEKNPRPIAGLAGGITVLLVVILFGCILNGVHQKSMPEGKGP